MIQPPSIQGNEELGATLTGLPGQWSAAYAYDYQWTRCAADGTQCVSTRDTLYTIDPVSDTYLVTQADMGYRLRFDVVAHGSLEATSATSELSEIVVDPEQDELAAPAFTIPPGGWQTIEPNESGGQTTTLYNADGSLYARRSTDVEGDVIDSVWFSGGIVTERRAATYRSLVESRGPLASPRCTNLSTNPATYRWITTHEWEFRAGSTPTDLNRTAAQQNIGYGHRAWELNENDCSISDTSTINFTFGGRSGREVLKGDGIGVVVFTTGARVARLCEDEHEPGKVILACARTFAPPPAINEIRDCDILINRDVTPGQTGSGWGMSGAAGLTDLWAVIAHEVGHCIGFDHVYNRQSVMWETYADVTAAQATAWRSLSKGDAEANNDKY